MLTKQFYWYNFAGFCSNLKQFYWYKWCGLLFKLSRLQAFQLFRGLLLGAYWLAGSRSPDGGGESHHFTGNRNPSPGRLPAPARQPHIIKLISQLQKPTRKISDTWIIDTGKRETRYQLVKIHQTIRQPHKVTSVMFNSLQPYDCSPPDSFVHGILQAWILEWVAMPSSRGSSLPRDRTCVIYHLCHLGNP